MTKKTKEPGSNFIDSLQLEETAQQLENLKTLIFNSTETNATKIEVIKEELSAGRYEIHSDRIAEKLLEFAPAIETKIEKEEPEIA